MHLVKNTLSDLIKTITLKNSKTTKKNDDDFVEINKKDKVGYRLIATKKRANALCDKKDEVNIQPVVSLKSLKKPLNINDIMCSRY